MKQIYLIHHSFLLPLIFLCNQQDNPGKPYHLPRKKWINLSANKSNLHLFPFHAHSCRFFQDSQKRAMRTSYKFFSFLTPCRSKRHPFFKFGQKPFSIQGIAQQPPGIPRQFFPIHSFFCSFPGGSCSAEFFIYAINFSFSWKVSKACAKLMPSIIFSFRLKVGILSRLSISWALKKHSHCHLVKWLLSVSPCDFILLIQKFFQVFHFLLLSRSLVPALLMFII